jgi:chemotaxis protein histidine kinase CheA
MSKPPCPPAPPKGQAVTIEPGRYPVFSSAVAMGLSRALRDPETAAKAGAAMAAAAEPMRDSVLTLVLRIEEAARADDFARLYGESHEIRGLAGNAGLEATARIANELCRYLDGFAQAGRSPDRAVIRLHLEAIARSVCQEETPKLSDAVAKELAQLVEKKLAEINTPETP